MRITSLLILGLLLSHCSYEPAEPGLCKLNCGKAIVGGNDTAFRIQKKSLDQDVVCPAAAAGQDIEDPFIAQFVVGEAFKDVRQGEEVEEIRPVPNISFEAIVNGLRSEDPARSPNVTQTNGVFAPARYKGIATPLSNWCSDTCGVATVEVFGRCPGPGGTTELSIQIHSGALYPDDQNTAKFNVSTLEPE